MGMITAEITLINAVDLANAKKHIIGEEEIRQINVSMLVDSGSYMMCINENIQEQLGLPVKERRATQLADNSWVEYNVVGPIEVKFANRTATCNAFILPGDADPLLGAIPMEEMDVLIHPKSQELIINPAHPDYAVLRI